MFKRKRKEKEMRKQSLCVSQTQLTRREILDIQIKERRMKKA